jgi:thiol-disulfide isomerase/thioredoxin
MKRRIVWAFGDAEVTRLGDPAEHGLSSAPMTAEQQHRRQVPPDRRTTSISASWVFLAVAGAIVALGVLAIALSAGGDSGEDLGPQTRAVQVGGAALAPFEGLPDPAVGMPAPELRGEDFAGTPVVIADDGRAKAIAFLAHWCPHCQAEAPRLADFLESTGMPGGVDLYIVPTGTSASQPNYPPQTWLEREGLGAVATLVDSDDGAAMQAAGGTAFPYWVFVDAGGEVALRLSGELPEGAFAEIVRRLDAGQPLTGDLEPGPASEA